MASPRVEDEKKETLTRDKKRKHKAEAEPVKRRFTDQKRSQAWQEIKGSESQRDCSDHGIGTTKGSS